MDACPSLASLIGELREIWRTVPDIEARMTRAKPVLERVIRDETFKERTRAWPLTPGQNLLFYEDPDFGFVLNGTVRQPGSPEMPHDHAHSWTVYGIVEGTESMQRYERLDKNGAQSGQAELKLISVKAGHAGDVDLVEPYDIHFEAPGPTRSSALILRSERLVGRTPQRLFNLKTKTVVEGSGPKQVPYSF